MNKASRILVVDDEPSVRLVFRTALDSVGYRVDEAPDGAEALERLERSTFSIVLLDLLMPVVGGMEVLRRLREKGNDVPVVIVTAHGTIPDAVEAMKLGAIDFLAKPVTPDVLRGVVADVIERHAQHEPQVPASPHPPGPTVITIARSVLDLTAAKRALNRREFEKATELLEEAIAVAPDSAEALTLKGVLLESQGQGHAAYHAYKQALTVHPHYGPARENMRRYCVRAGLDADNPRINPAAGH